MTKILFVCLGNICRSPLAEGIAKSIAKKRSFVCKIDSAGTSDFHAGEPPCKDSIKVANLHHIDITSLRARQVIPDDAKAFDYVIAMDAQNKQTLKEMGFEDVYLLGEFGGYEGKDVPDPYFFDTFDDGIKSVYTMISECVEDFIEKAAHGSIRYNTLQD